MPRIKIELPEKTLFTVTVPVRISDINYGNHVGNDAFVSILHEARVKWLKSCGFTELDIDGTGLIMSDLSVEFKNESLYGDQIIVRLFTGEIGRVNFELYYELTTQRTEQPLLLAKARTNMVCFDYKARKTVAVPEKLLAIINVQ
ncbi:MAG: acyl-CoA thioesterase [Chitinophagaceae bacterium]|nr:acyl-CoA thioesterase [Chitinophagaceae bacterium]